MGPAINLPNCEHNSVKRNVMVGTKYTSENKEAKSKTI